METFSQFRLSNGTLDAIAAKGYETPSPIQKLAIPPLVDGRDLIAQAQTGTGKTAGFGIPMIERHRGDPIRGIVALTLVPTRELAIQVAEEIEALARGSKLRVVAIYGGAGFGKQLDALEQGGPLLLVATPGRLLDHMERGSVRLDQVRTLILDEADRMLDMGFVRDVERILRQVPRDRQTALFSATVPDEIRSLSKRYLKDPVSVRAESGPTAVESATQFHLRVGREEKHDALVSLLHQEVPERAIVFTRTKHLAKRLADRLRKGGWNSVALQGNMTQGQRERAMSAFRDGQARILVATDVAARGLDVPEVSHVVNYDLPDGADTYVHRIGRTARMGRSGRAFTFVQPDEHNDMRQIERGAGTRIAPLEISYAKAAEWGPDPVAPAGADPLRAGRVQQAAASHQASPRGQGRRRRGGADRQGGGGSGGGNGGGGGPRRSGGAGHRHRRGPRA